MSSIFVFLLSFVFGISGAFLISKSGEKLSLIDTPNERSSHQRVTPRGGGIGILMAVVLGGTAFGIHWYFLIPAVIISCMSLIDDRYNLPLRVRVLSQLLCSFVFVLFFLRSGHPVSVVSPFSVLLVFYTLYIVATANFYNFMDGINGIAAISGIVGFGLLAFYGYRMGKDTAAIKLSICIALACLGFLPFNIPKASVFMGDVGSILLGFSFGGMVVIFSDSILEFLVLLSFLFPFYADEGLTILERLLKKESLWKAHRQHLYQFLTNERGFTHWKISFSYGIVQLIIGTFVWYASRYYLTTVIVLLVLLAIMGTLTFAAFKSGKS